MPERFDLGILVFDREADHGRFAFSNPDQIALEIPPHCEQTLAAKLRDILPAKQSLPLSLDLQNRSGLSSRHLGVMLALQKALRERCPRLQLTGVHENIRKLLETTRIHQFFDIVD